jgi:DNA segregation ATPase FtsK/SpoIIIE-like protein
LNVETVRIPNKLVVYQGKSYLSIEAPHKSTETLAWNDARREGYKIPLGVDNLDETVIWDMDNHSTPHILVCGATGSGKSVCIRSTIEFALAAGITDIHIMDPKYEFTELEDRGCKVYNDISDVEAAMARLVQDMQQRTKTRDHHKTLIIFDEFADAVSQARQGVELDIREKVEVGEYKNGQPKMEWRVTGRDKSLEENLKMLLQKGRSLGFRILAATQRASTKVITGDAKANFPVQVCFRVPKSIDSQVVLDEEGAEALAGRGDGLIKSPEYIGLKRFQGFFLQ